MSVGGVLSETWELYKRFFARLVLTAAVVYALLSLFEATVAEAAADTAGGILWALIGVVISLVGLFWVQGALVEAVRDVRDGRADLSVADLYARTRSRLPALIAAGLLAGIGIAVGFVLLIVPGLYLLTRWSMLVPVIVLEGRRTGEAFSRSWELVRGNAWNVFGLVVVTLLGAALAQGVLAALFAWLPDFFATWIGGTVANSLVIPFAAVALTLAYYRLADVQLSREASALTAE